MWLRNFEECKLHYLIITRYWYANWDHRRHCCTLQCTSAVYKTITDKYTLYITCTFRHIILSVQRFVWEIFNLSSFSVAGTSKISIAIVGLLLCLQYLWTWRWLLEWRRCWYYAPSSHFLPAITKRYSSSLLVLTMQLLQTLLCCFKHVLRPCAVKHGYTEHTYTEWTAYNEESFIISR